MAEMTTRTRLYCFAFFLVELFAAIEVTAVVVSTPSIAVSLGIGEAHSSWVINSYLYPVFLTVLLFLTFSAKIAQRVTSRHFFLVGLAGFAAGNVVCLLAMSPEMFFAGRVLQGFFAAMAFAGQLWTLSDYFAQSALGPLFWGECGAAIGVVSGPVIGGLFSGLGPQGWRLFFVFNGCLALLTLVSSGFILSSARPDADPSNASKSVFAPSFRLHFPIGFWLMIIAQVAASATTVGAEYLYSDHLQLTLHRTPFFVGLMTAIASVGAILGSAWVARRKADLRKLPLRSVMGMVVATMLLGAAMYSGSILSSSVPIFAIGLLMGMANVAIYACLMQLTAPSQQLTVALIYLVASQSGNALGIQWIWFAEQRDWPILVSSFFLAALPAGLALVVLAMGRVRRSCAVD